MDTAEAEKLLGAYLFDGTGTQILWADQAYELAKEISNHRERYAEASFEELFYTLFVILSDRHTLEATKLLDPKGLAPQFAFDSKLQSLNQNY